MKPFLRFLSALALIALLDGCAALSESGKGHLALHPVGGGQPDFVEAREQFKAGAAKGDPVSESSYAAMCMAGLGGPVDMSAAWENIQAADKQGSLIAAMLLTDLYARGDDTIGVERNLDRALAAAHRVAKSNKETSATLVAWVQRLQRGEAPEQVVQSTPQQAAKSDANSANTDSRPVTIEEAIPSYPIPLQALGLTGEVIVDLKVKPDGVPADVHVVRSTLPQFDEAAIGAVSRFRFLPGMKSGRPVTTHIQVPIYFDVN